MRIHLTCLLLSFTTPALAVGQEAPPAPEPAVQSNETASDVGAWSGRFDGRISGPGLENGLGVSLVLEVAGEPPALRGTIDIPEQGLLRGPLTDFAPTAEGYSFRIDNVPGEPTFRVALDGDALAGSFTQGGVEFVFEGLRTDVAALAAERLAGLDEELQALLDQWVAPGLGLAVVFRGETVLTAGYGVRGPESEAAVDAQTLFAIGSSSKAFTATTLALLEAEGRVDLDAPVTEALPRFRLQDEIATRLATPRDLLSHRTGLPRHDLVWYGDPDFTLARLLEMLPHLEPTAELRETFQYNNLMFGVAGLLIEAAAGQPWTDAMQQRLLDPLGMGSTVFSSAAAEATGRLAEPTERKGRRAKPLPLREIVGIGPAGSLHSTAEDMARWLLLNLEHGMVDAVEILSARRLAELHRPRTPIGGLPPSDESAPAAYAQGWFVDGYQGHVRVHHGGNIDGYSTLVAMLPNQRVGVVAMTNQNGSPIPSLAIDTVFRRLLELEPAEDSSLALAQAAEMEATLEAAKTRRTGDRVKDTAPARALEAYCGTFAHPAYGPFTIARGEDGLTLTRFGATHDLDHWHYEVFRIDRRADEEHLQNLALHFRADLEGLVTTVEIAIEAGLDPLRFDLQPDPRLSDPEHLRAFAGDYSLPGQRISFALESDHLTAVLPGQPIWTLRPLRGTTFELVELPGYRVRFTLDESGRPTEAAFIQPEGTFVAQRMDSDSFGE